MVQGADGAVMATISEGGFFGEISLVFDQKRTASVFAVGYCELLALEKADFNQVLEDYPDEGVQVVELAMQRQRALAQAGVSLNPEPEEEQQTVVAPGTTSELASPSCDETAQTATLRGGARAVLQRKRRSIIENQ